METGTTETNVLEKLADEWGLYWRGALVLAFLLGAMLIPSLPKKDLSSILHAFVLFGFSSFAFYPFFLLTRYVFGRGVVMFIAYTICLSAAPLMAGAWVLMVLFISKYILHVLKFFKYELPAVMVLYGLAAFFALRTLPTAGEMPAPAAGPGATHAAPTLAQKLGTIRATTEKARSTFTEEAEPTPIPAATVEEEIVPDREIEEFRDPKGYYTVMLPAGYKMEDRSNGSQSKKSFNYSKDLSLWLLANEMRKSWDPESAMKEKMEAINSGRAGFPSDVKVVSHGLIELNGAKGYEFIIEGAGQGNKLRAYTVALVSNKTSMAVSITCTGESDLPLFNQIQSSIAGSLRLSGPPSPKSFATAKSPSSTPTPHAAGPASASDWQKARTAIKIDGILLRGHNHLVLVGTDIYNEGDTL
ncbi:MAG: hypothetical protein V2A34_03320, partial [Lentisphaerota bacterium]